MAAAVWHCGGVPLAREISTSGVRRRRHAHRQRRGSSPLACAAAVRSPEAVQHAAAAVLEWATGQRLHELPVTVSDLELARGRGLIAVQDVGAGETLLSVPLDHVYESQPEDEEQELHWSVEMALRLLRDRHACRRAQAAQWCTWLDSLPRTVCTPLEFGPAALAHVRDDVVLRDVTALQQCLAASYEVLADELGSLGCTQRELLDAVQVLHSRCFFLPEAQRHVAVPGVDMANHSPEPSAQVRVRRSPGAVQGLAALEEVADPATCAAVAAEQSRFELVAARDIARGEEVCISYGPWPDTAFFLLFGFVPEHNPHSAVVVLDGVWSVAESLASLWQRDEALPPLEADQLGAALEQALDAAPPELQQDAWQACHQLCVTRQGWDGRLQQAVLLTCQLIASAGGEGGGLARLRPHAERALQQLKGVEAPGLLRDVVLRACVGKLGQLQGGPSEEVAAEEEAGVQLAKRFTARQVDVLQEAISQLRKLP